MKTNKIYLSKDFWKIIVDLFNWRNRYYNRKRPLHKTKKSSKVGVAHHGKIR